MNASFTRRLGVVGLIGIGAGFAWRPVLRPDRAVARPAREFLQDETNVHDSEEDGTETAKAQ